MRNKVNEAINRFRLRRSAESVPASSEISVEDQMTSPSPEEDDNLDQSVKSKSDYESVTANPRTFFISAISSGVVDLYSDCPQRFDFFSHGEPDSSIHGVPEEIDAWAMRAIELILALPPSSRTHSEVGAAVERARLLGENAFKWADWEEGKHAERQVSDIVHRFLDTHPIDGSTTAQDISLTAWVPGFLGETMIEALVHRVVVEPDEDGVTLVAYDMGEPDRFRHPVEMDPVFRMWLVAVADSTEQKVNRIKNVFVKHPIEEVLEIRDGDVELARTATGYLIDRLRLSEAERATPGPWCVDCQFRAICPDCAVPIKTEMRVSSRGGII